MRLNCVINFKKPCHVGYGEKAQVRDFRDKPYLPSQVLTSHIYSEALRFALPLGKKISTPKVSDGITPEEPRFVKVIGEEFFRNRIYFSLEIEEGALDIFLAALKSLQNSGIGANTSQGLGYCEIKVLETDQEISDSTKEKFDLFEEGKFYSPFFVKLAQAVFNNISRNWKSWSKSYRNLGPFKKRSYYRVEPEEKISSRKFRGFLRRRLLEFTGIEHGEVPVCSPRKEPCFVCKMIGAMGVKSRIIAREFPQEDKTIIYLICENFSEEEERVLKGGLEGIKYELVMEESIKDYEHAP